MKKPRLKSLESPQWGSGLKCNPPEIGFYFKLVSYQYWAQQKKLIDTWKCHEFIDLCAKSAICMYYIYIHVYHMNYIHYTMYYMYIHSPEACYRRDRVSDEVAVQTLLL